LNQPTPAQNPYFSMTPHGHRHNVSPNDNRFHRAPRANLPIAIAANGIEIIDSEGKRYIDHLRCAYRACTRNIASSMPSKRQAQPLPSAHTIFSSHAVAERIVRPLISVRPKAWPTLLHIRRLRSDRSPPSTRAAYFRLKGTGAASSFHHR